MGTTSVKKPHKFFDKILDNDLELLTSQMMQLREDLIEGNFADIPEDVLQEYREDKDSMHSQVTGLAGYYNIFEIDNPAIAKLKSALGDLVLEACEYYGIDPEPQEYYIRGWLNVTYGTSMHKGMERPEYYSKAESFHEHNDGMGIPDTHGYYCVNAEPSITHYMIDKVTLRENHNINNRVVLSETGHPHRIDLWEYDTPRITIAYDVCPKKKLLDGISIPLW